MTAKCDYWRPIVLATVAFFACIFRLAAQPTGKAPTEFPAEPPLLTAKPLEGTPNDDDLRKLLKALYNERLAQTSRHYRNLRGGINLNTEALVDSARRLLSAGLEIHQGPKEKIDFVERMLELCNKGDMIADHIDGKKYATIKPETRVLERHKLREFRLELQIEILRAKKAGGDK